MTVLREGEKFPPPFYVLYNRALEIQKAQRRAARRERREGDK
jgi:hypothetical protein